MAQFRAQIGGKRIREVENKNYRFTPFLSGAEQKMPKKKQKIKKYHYGHISSQNSFKKGNKGRK